MVFVPATTGLLCILLATQYIQVFTASLLIYKVDAMLFFPHVDGNGPDPLLPDTME